MEWAGCPRGLEKCNVLQKATKATQKLYQQLISFTFDSIFDIQMVIKAGLQKENIISMNKLIRFWTES